MSVTHASDLKSYERIKNEKMIIDPLIWDLIGDHLVNDVYAINAILGSTVLDGDPLSKENAKKIIQHGEELIEFFKNLENLTNPKKMLKT